MKLAIYKATLPVKAQASPEKMSGFTAFIAGAKKHGVQIIETNKGDYVPSDIGLMFSFVDLHQPDEKLIPYMKTRKRIFMKSKNLFFFENDVLKDFNDELVMRFPFQSVYDHEAEYFLDCIPEDRGNSPSFPKLDRLLETQHRLQKPAKTVITLNRLAGYGRCGVVQCRWAYETIKEIRGCSHSKSLVPRMIEVRLHPGNVHSPRRGKPRIKDFQIEEDKNYFKKILRDFPDVKICLPKRGSYTNQPLSEAVHVFNSSSASCESILKDSRTVVTHPSAFSWDFSPHSMDELASGVVNDRAGVLRKYKKTHFTAHEVRSGLYWDLIKDGVKEVL